MKAYTSPLMDAILADPRGKRAIQEALSIYDHHADKPVSFLFKGRTYLFQIVGKKK